MNMFPHFPLHLNTMTLFGMTLILGLVGGELARRTRYLPIISGYILIGFLVGPGGFNLTNDAVLLTSRIFIEISLSLVLFELGRQLDFRWVYHDRGLLPMAIGESGFTFLIVFIVLFLLVGLSALQAAFGATIAMATSPAVIMMIANDLSAEGPVTRRTLILTSFNNLFALLLFSFLLPLAKTPNFSHENLIHISYQIFGSIILGLLVFGIAEILGFLIGKKKENQFVLFVGLVVLTTGLSHIFNFSTMLSLFVLGAAARNLDKRHILMDVDFGWLARLFFILLFVASGTHLKLKGLSSILFIVMLIIIGRALAKTLGIYLFANMSSLTKQQIFTTSLALSPMAGVAIGMSNILVNVNPEFGHLLLVIITGVITILQILGPIATQLAFIISNETLSIERK